MSTKKAKLTREKEWEKRQAGVIFERIPTGVGWAVVEGVPEGAGVHLIAFFAGGRRARKRADALVMTFKVDDELGPMAQPAVLVGEIVGTSDDGLFVANHYDTDEAIKALSDAYLISAEEWTK